MSLLETLNMPVSQFKKWSKYIPIAEAREHLKLNAVSAYPSLKKDSMSETHKQLKRTAYPVELSEHEVSTMSDAKITMERFLNGK